MIQTSSCRYKVMCTAGSWEERHPSNGVCRTKVSDQKLHDAEDIRTLQMAFAPAKNLVWLQKILQVSEKHLMKNSLKLFLYSQQF